MLKLEHVVVVLRHGKLGPQNVCSRDVLVSSRQEKKENSEDEISIDDECYVRVERG